MKLLLENWREYINENKAKPKLRIFDFDDTIAKSDSNIHITTDTGEKIEMTPGEYATHKINPNYKYDFSEFDEVINPREIKQITNIIRNALNAGTEEREIAVLTARDPAAEGPICQSERNTSQAISLPGSRRISPWELAQRSRPSTTYHRRRHVSASCAAIKVSSVSARHASSMPAPHFRAQQCRFGWQRSLVSIHQLALTVCIAVHAMAFLRRQC